MKKIAIIYKSHYGATKQYAEWIAEALDASLFEMSQVKPPQLMDYDVVVYGGGLYAGGINGAKLVAKNPCKQTLVVFTVGLADPETTDFSDIVTKSLSQKVASQSKVFHLRGGIDYSKLGVFHKTAMAMVKKKAENTPVAERTKDDVMMIETYGKKICFMDKDSITPLVEYIRSL